MVAIILCCAYFIVDFPHYCTYVCIFPAEWYEFIFVRQHMSYAVTSFVVVVIILLYQICLALQQQHRIAALCSRSSYGFPPVLYLRFLYFRMLRQPAAIRSNALVYDHKYPQVSHHTVVIQMSHQFSRQMQHSSSALLRMRGLLTLGCHSTGLNIGKER